MSNSKAQHIAVKLQFGFPPFGAYCENAITGKYLSGIT